MKKDNDKHEDEDDDDFIDDDFDTVYFDEYDEGGFSKMKSSRQRLEEYMDQRNLRNMLEDYL